MKNLHVNSYTAFFFYHLKKKVHFIDIMFHLKNSECILVTVHKKRVLSDNDDSMFT